VTALLMAIVLTWTAPGDDGSVGTAAAYDVRYARDSLTLVTWTSATQATGEPAPRVSGTPESFSIDPGQGTWWFAIRARDEAGNLSGPSNIVSRTVGDTTGSCLIATEGDVNSSGTVTSADIIRLVNYLFRGLAPPAPCAAAGDLNCTGSVTAADVIHLVSYCFKGMVLPCDICAESPLPCP